jgi:hypothetical protein
MRVQGRRRVPGKRDVVGLAECRNLQKSGDTSTTRNIGLLHVDRARRKHSLKIENVVAIFACRDLHFYGSTVPNQTKPFQVVGGNWLFEPADAEIVEYLRLPKCLLA